MSTTRSGQRHCCRGQRHCCRSASPPLARSSLLLWLCPLVLQCIVSEYLFFTLSLQANRCPSVANKSCRYVREVHKHRKPIVQNSSESRPKVVQSRLRIFRTALETACTSFTTRSKVVRTSSGNKENFVRHMFPSIAKLIKKFPRSCYRSVQQVIQESFKSPSTIVQRHSFKIR